MGKSHEDPSPGGGHAPKHQGALSASDPAPHGCDSSWVFSVIEYGQGIHSEPHITK